MMMAEGKQVLVHNLVDLVFNDKAIEMLGLNPPLVVLVVNGNPSTWLQTFMLSVSKCHSVQFYLAFGQHESLF